ncbi:MAG: hypothetical protein ACR2P7_05375 [bacterium]
MNQPSETIPVDLREKTELGGIYNLPGEGFVVELHQGSASYLFDKQGLQHRILQKKQRGLDASVEEAALLRISNFPPVFETW